MWVERIAFGDPILSAAREQSGCSEDGCFSAQDVAAHLSLDVGDVLSELDKLQEMDWITRDGDGSVIPNAQESRWIVRVHACLTVGRRYEVLGICADNYQVLDDDDDPILFDPSGFRIIDDAEPEFWVNDWGDDGERYAHPEAWSRPGFFEDYHDRVRAVRDEFWDGVRELYPETWEERRHAR